MINIDYRSGVAIYEQVVRSFEQLIHCGALKKDEKLPSVRELSIQLAVNPNTVQKAYSALEQKGLIYSVKGLGNFVSDETHDILTKRYNEILLAISRQISELISLGYDKTKLEKQLLAFAKKEDTDNDNGY